MSAPTDILDWWPLILALFAVIAWGFRLEAKVRMQEQTYSNLSAELTKVAAAVAAHEVTTVQLARMEERVNALVGRVSEQNDTMRELFGLIRALPQKPTSV